ncbi:hypothetical protein [Polaribacter sp.]|uniref:hypothetical protein n=1 Tax=Polaribacter sp. TaxID=1920175 RepID=UPI003EF5439D
MKSTTATSTKNFFIEASKKIKISPERKVLLENIAEQIAKEYVNNKSANINFICTHNSRRSQLAQVWGFFAAHYFNLKISSFSGGTETTAFYRSTVKTLQRAGFIFQLEDFSHQNPTYLISFLGASSSILGFSKRFDHTINTTPFLAILTCDNADVNCPFIPNAIARLYLPFVDPKSSDGTNLQAEAYLKTNKQIAAEIFFIFSKVKDLVS